MAHDRTAADVNAESVQGSTFVSLVLFIHVFCLLVVLSSNLVPSALQQALLEFVAPYARTLNLDPNFTRYYLTHGSEEHDDHVLTAEAEGVNLLRLPDVGFRGGMRRRRYHVLAANLAFFANRESDSVTGQFAKALGAHVLTQLKQDKVLVRCRMHRAQSRELSGLPEDPDSQAYFDTIYEADVWKASDGTIQLLKRSPTREVAPSTRGPSR